MGTEPLIMLHLSDIHFHERRSTGVYDLDADLRNELERDAKQLHDALGHVDGILVTGDIAFAGKQKEYEVALTWLQTLCANLNCPAENIWTTPGNHDVDRSVVDKSKFLRSLHKELRPLNPQNVDAELLEVLEDPSASRELFQPIQNYINFASKFGCAPGHNVLYWEHDLSLNDRSILRLRGLNSTLVSDSLDNDREYKLVLGSLQTTLKREDGVAYMTLCHHPPSWLIDQDKVETILNARACIQLFGHKHVQRVQQINNSLRLAAGAVHPDRKESDWQPRYNFLCLAVRDAGSDRRLEIKVYPRVWSDTGMVFQGDYDSGGSDCRTFSLTLEPWKAPIVSTASPQTPELDLELSDSNKPGPPETIAIEGSGSRTMDPARTLTYRFLTLPYHERIEIAQKLSLLQDEDKSVQDQDGELFRRFFRRAREKAILAQLWEEVELHHGDGKHSGNPFVQNEGLGQ